MKISIVRKLEVEKEVKKGDNFNDYLELGAFDNATIWTKDGQCYSAEIQEVHDSEIIIADEDKRIKHIPLVEIEDIEEG